MKKFKKIIFVIGRNIIKLVNYISSKQYTRLYCKWLKWGGLHFHGYPDYIDPSAWIDGVDYSLISIGKNTVISSDVILLTHDYSITRGLQSINKLDAKSDVRFLKKVSIGENSFIGARAIILPGSTIGNNVIVGSGSVISGTIPNNVVIAGNPAKVLTNTKEWAIRKYDKKEYSYSK